MEPQVASISEESREMAIGIAAEKEKAEQPDVTDLKARLVRTVIWPDEPPGRVVHEVQIYSEDGFSPTYFVDASTGSIIFIRDNDIE